MTIHSETVSRTSYDCWRKLEIAGGIHPRYDADLLDEICRALALDSTKAMGRQLRARSVPVERFIEAFFSAVEPYARMMRDLLVFFESARAVESSTGVLRIAFDFGHKIPGLEFDLESFRVWERRIEHVLDPEQRDEPAWNHDYLTRLCSILERAASPPRAPAQAGASDTVLAQWLLDYREGLWPEDLPPRPAAPQREFRAAFDVAWDLWIDVVGASHRIGRSRTQLRSITWQPRDTAGVSRSYDPWLLRLLDAMEWAGRMASSLSAVAENADALQSFSQGLHELLGAMPRRPVASERLLERFEAFLSLPVWERRHDLYAAWIGARIAAEAGQQTHIHSVNGVLRYSFAGTHLATLRSAAGTPLFLWAELRSPLSTPMGRGRLRSIQPDYSVQRAPITYPESSLLVVECKQYLKASPKSFAAALTDYARGRPSARVLLVNYGPADSSILEQVDESVRGRTSVIGNCRPGSPESIERFTSLVRSALQLHAESVQPPARPQGTAGVASTLSQEGEVGPRAATGAVPGSSRPDRAEAKPRPHGTGLDPEAVVIVEGVSTTVVRCILGWSARPTDLDLYAWVRREDGIWHEVSYRNMGCLDGPPWSQLDRDCRNGNGPETLTISRPCVLRCAIHNYSKEVALKKSAAELRIEMEATVLVIQCPSHGTGNWWDAVEVDVPGHCFKVLNRIQDNLPLDVGGQPHA